MKLGARLIILLLWLYVVYACALLLFSKGFLLKRIVINNSSSCETNNWLVQNIYSGIRTKVRFQPDNNNVPAQTATSCDRPISPRYKKAIFVIIDGLRYDFLQHNNNLKAVEEMPYQNKMRKLHQLLSKQPRNGKLFKFEADPPTTTMQRIKGLTTGSLPTFIDAGSNFASYEITEDNILDHVIRQKKNISFMGCSTWSELYPKHFQRSTPYSALNVKDLDTIDYGIIRHLPAEVARSDWLLLIVHFLGVDHCGHRYGTNHPEMTRKLTEMDNVISDLTSQMDDETVLFVMGDHGMTITGDHGGDSKDEVMAGLFAYSKTPIFHPKVDDTLPTVSQIDLVPTLSLLLDLPIPFSNLGSLIPHFFTGDTHHLFLPEHLKNNVKNEHVARVFQQINKNYAALLNCRQIFTYIEHYQRLSDSLPREQIAEARASYEFTEERFQDLLDGLVLIDWQNATEVEARLQMIQDTADEFEVLFQSFSEVLRHVKGVCRNIWAQFDEFSICLGLTLMVFITTVAFVLPSSMDVEMIKNAGRTQTFITVCGFLFVGVGLAYMVLPFQDARMASIVVFLAASFSFSVWLLMVGVKVDVGSLVNKHALFNLSKTSCFFLACFLLQLGSLFANSYIIYEDATVMFCLQSFLLFYAGNHFLNMLRLFQVQSQARSNRTFAHLKTKLANFCFNTNSVKFAAKLITCLLCVRLTKPFWFCREMQLLCNVSTYSLPLAALITEFTARYANERLLMAVVALAGMTSATYGYMRYRGNMNGLSSAVVIVKYFMSTSVPIIGLHWSLQLVLEHEISALIDIPFIQQIALPRVVYIYLVVSVIILSVSPLCIYTVYRKPKDGETTPPPMVYGLKTVYSSPIIVLLAMLAVVATLVLSDGMTAPLVLLWLGGYCFIALFSLDRLNGHATFSELLTPVLAWSMFSWFGFFGTGHQTSIPAIRFPAAYIGFRGSFPELPFQVLSILLNTFASQVVCTLALPLLLITRRELFWPSSMDTRGSEADLVDHPFTTRLNLFKMYLLYIAVNLAKVSISACSAALHRRHLMVWKIFAPRMLFEAVAYLVTTPLVLLTFAFVLRIDNKLRTWIPSLKQN